MRDRPPGTPPAAGTMDPVATPPGPADERSAGPAEAVPAVPPATEKVRSPEAPTRPVGRLDEIRCSVRALRREDSPVATAAPAQRWLLIEQPGPWGREALTESRFDPEVAPLLAKRSRAENVRLLLVRRPGEGRGES